MVNQLGSGEKLRPLDFFAFGFHNLRDQSRKTILHQHRRFGSHSTACDSRFLTSFFPSKTIMDSDLYDRSEAIQQRITQLRDSL